MKKLALTSALAATLTLSACATNPYGYSNNDPYYGNRNTSQGGRVAGGAAIGGVAGAVVGAVIPGVNPITGAIAGAVLGGVAAAVINNRQYYRDTRGACYYVDRNGQPIYDYNTRC
ncbi:MAG: hypothetical protein LH466_02400 [Sphingomonas bacterium]|nr:hypothetical protein [Sphingomonas bacterium]